MTAKRIPDDIIVVKVSRLRYRIARRGAGSPQDYSHLNKQPWGLTNIRKFEFITGPLSVGEMHDTLAELAEGDPQPHKG